MNALNQVSSLEKFFGTYRGISPTDDSPVAYGEMELILQRSHASIRMATGSRIMYETTPLALVPLSEDELRKHFKDDARYSSIQTTHGFRHEGGLDFLFLTNPKKDKTTLVLRGGMGDLLGPTVLLKDPSWFEYSLMIGPLALQGLPLLKYGGHSPNGLGEKIRGVWR